LPFDKRFKNKILNKVMKQVKGSQKDMEAIMNKVSKKLEKRFGDIGFYLALGLVTFAYGAYISGAIAFFVKIKMRQAMISIAIGSAISIVFWWYLANGAIPFITPTMVFLVVTGISIFLVGHGIIKDRQLVKKIKAEVSGHIKK
jgi:hypothetical protein